MKKSRLLGAMCACLFSLLSLSAHAVAVSGQGTWETTLQGRDLDGNAATFEAYYDTVLDITWLADTNAGAGSVFDDYGDVTDGLMTWASANAWAASLTLGGFTDWRLPTTSGPLLCSGTSGGYDLNCTGIEMGHMYYDVLGNDVYGGLSNTGPFVNMMADSYWSATEYFISTTDLTTNSAYRSYFVNGGLDETDKNFPAFAWAVHDGDVGAAVVPIPPALWLFGSGLLGLIGVARRRVS